MDNDSVEVTKVSQNSGKIVDFAGDGIVVPCDTDLTYRKSNDVVRDVTANAGDKLSEELAAIGYCVIGNVVITQGYNLKAKHLIFLPYTAREDKSRRMNYVLLHQATRSILSLASLYGLRTLAIPILNNLLSKRRNLIKGVVSKVIDTDEDGNQISEAESIIEGIAKGFESESLKEVIIYS